MDIINEKNYSKPLSSHRRELFKYIYNVMYIILVNILYLRHHKCVKFVLFLKLKTIKNNKSLYLLDINFYYLCKLLYNNTNELFS